MSQSKFQDKFNKLNLLEQYNQANSCKKAIEKRIEDKKIHEIDHLVLQLANWKISKDGFVSQYKILRKGM